MWAKRKKEERVEAGRGVACAAAAGASREELIREALQVLASEEGAQRLGVWLEPRQSDSVDRYEPAVLRGLVSGTQGESIPAEWARLSFEALGPPEWLAEGKILQQDLDDSSSQPVIGALLEMRRALWVPIVQHGHLRGLLLAASRMKNALLPRAALESVAAELALALEREEYQQALQARTADLSLSRRMLAALGGGEPANTTLLKLAEDCGEAGAAFAVIGQLSVEIPHAVGEAGIEFLWKWGDSVWTRAVENRPLAALWRRALETGRVIGAEPGLPLSEGNVARVVAIPLAAGGETLGVLVAGLAVPSASLAVLDRLELRASLAASALIQRKLAARELRRAARHRLLVENHPGPAVLVDLRGDIAGANHSARALLREAQPARVEPKNSRDAFPHVGARFAELFRARERERIDSWSRHALDPDLAGPARREDVPEAELCNGVRVRVSGAVPAEEDLVAFFLEPLPAAGSQESRAEIELRNVLEWLEEGVVVFGEDQAVRAMNTRFSQITGLGPSEAEECSTFDALVAHLSEKAADPENFAARWQDLARGLEGGVREELQLARPVPRVLERAARPILDEVGRRLGRVEIYRDLTAQRVFQSKLLQTEKLAALGQMLSGVAHELSNPLTTILGYSQRLLLHKDALGRTEEARQIFQEAERATTILRQLLLTARETRPERRRVSLNQVVLRTLELQRFTLASEKIRIETSLDPILPFIWGDSGQLQQILMNLIANARQSIDQRGQGGAIRLRTARGAGNQVLLEVKDDGLGVPEAILARIFDPFFTTKPAGIGTGLGLSIVLSIVREHGGRVHVSNPPGGGALFTVELPAAAPAAETEPRPVPAIERRRAVAASARFPEESTPRLPPVAGRPRENVRVMVVEDEPTVARLIADVLTDEGVHAEVLFDAREALERAAHQSYDLVICDMKMPGMDGQNFFKALERSGNVLRHRFLFVTGDVIAPHTHEFLERHGLPHVAKPFRIEELTEKVRSLLGSGAQPDADLRKNATWNG